MQYRTLNMTGGSKFYTNWKMFRTEVDKVDRDVALRGISSEIAIEERENYALHSQAVALHTMKIKGYA